jgi:hypothetical protein
MFSLRAGPTVLAHGAVRGRLAEIDETQLRRMVVLLQSRNGIAPSWSEEEIKRLVEAWIACHE